MRAVGLDIPTNPSEANPVYHLSVKSVSRSDGRSATAAAAYRSGEVVIDQRTGQVHDYRKRSGVHAVGMIGWTGSRSDLWSSAELAEKRKDAKVAREYEVNLPAETTDDDRKSMVERFGQWLANRYGVAVDWAIHSPPEKGDQRHWHAHILTTTRRIDGGQLAEKTRILDCKQTAQTEVEAIRAEWSQRCIAATHDREKWDHRSFARRGIDRISTGKKGVSATAYERRTGTPSRRGQWIGQRMEAHRAAQAAKADWLAAQALLDEALAAEIDIQPPRPEQIDIQRTQFPREAVAPKTPKISPFGSEPIAPAEPAPRAEKPSLWARVISLGKTIKTESTEDEQRIRIIKNRIRIIKARIRLVEGEKSAVDQSRRRAIHRRLRSGHAGGQRPRDHSQRRDAIGIASRQHPHSDRRRDNPRAVEPPRTYYADQAIASISDPQPYGYRTASEIKAAKEAARRRGGGIGGR